MSEAAVPQGYGRWLIAIVAVLLVSLMLFAGNIAAGFFYFTARSTPVWVTVLGVIALFGIAAAFGGLFLLLVVAGIGAWRSEKRRAAIKG